MVSHFFLCVCVCVCVCVCALNMCYFPKKKRIQTSIMRGFYIYGLYGGYRNPCTFDLSLSPSLSGVQKYFSKNGVFVSKSQSPVLISLSCVTRCRKGSDPIVQSTETVSMSRRKGFLCSWCG